MIAWGSFISANYKDNPCLWSFGISFSSTDYSVSAQSFGSNLINSAYNNAHIIQTKTVSYCTIKTGFTEKLGLYTIAVGF